MGEFVFRGWMYDLAREQSPTEAQLGRILERSLSSGYNAVGIYVEHRLAYASVPWVGDAGSLQPEVVRRLTERFRARGLRIIPFLNTLGHMEGFLRVPGGNRFAEVAGRAGSSGDDDFLFCAPLSEQICPSRAECLEFVRGLVADAIEVFSDEWIHLGGDETKQLGSCSRCAERAERIGVGGIYGTHMGELCRQVLEAGRRPCIWGDMLLTHPEAMDYIPPETIIFDWQYETGPRETSRVFRDRGFEVVCCPSVQSYNSGWCFLDATQRNIDEHAEDARELGALGVLVTTWEQIFFSSYESIEPVIFAAGRRLGEGIEWADALVMEGGAGLARAVEILGNRIPAVSSFLGPGTWRQLRDRLVMRGNPFHLWREWRDEACGEVGDRILELCDAATDALASDGKPADGALLLAIELHRVSVAFVRMVEEAFGEFGDGRFESASDGLESAAGVLERLRPGLSDAAGQGGSAKDPARLDRLVEIVRATAKRIEECGRSRSPKASFESVVLPDVSSGA